MFSKNSKISSQKENNAYEDRDPKFMGNSSVVDILVQSLQSSSSRQRRPQQIQQSKPENIFKLVSNRLNNSQMQNSQQSQQNSQQRGLFSKKRPSIIENNDKQFFKKTQEDESVSSNTMRDQTFADLLQQSERRFFAQLKKQEEYCEGVKQQMRKSFKLLVQQLNNKFTGVQKKIVQIGEQNMVTSSGLELFKQMTEKRTQELVARLDSARFDKLEQSGYDVDLEASREAANRPFSEQIELRYQEQLLDLSNQINRLREEMKTQQTSLTVPSQPFIQSNSKEDIQQLRQYIDNCLKQKDRVLEPKFIEIDRVLRIHDENITKMNSQFQRVFNQHLNPRIFKLQEWLKKPTEDGSKKTLQDIIRFKENLEEKLKTCKIIQVRKTSQQENSVLSKMGSINMGDTYFIDENRYLMDSQGIYLTDENNARIKVEQNQLCFLAANGITINN